MGETATAMMTIAEPWPGLAMSRVLGHRGVNRIGIISDADDKSYQLTTADKAIIVASDGVWDFVEEEEAVAIVKHYAPDADAACKALVETANQRWVEDDPTYRDDISAVVAFMPLGGSELASADSIVFTSDNASAVEEKRAEAAKIAVPGAPPVPVPQDGTIPAPVTGVADVKVQMPGAKPPLDEDAAARRRRIKASKEQMRRSVATKFG